MHWTQTKRWLKGCGARWWAQQVAGVNAIQRAIPVKHVVIRNRFDLVVFWVKTAVGATLALLLFYLALSHGAPR